uniref:Uncharacterized protein n=1 Tax=Anguilla anguilla TaxID=7936 RepID=A0A0E9T0Q2_ANGAN
MYSSGLDEKALEFGLPGPVEYGLLLRV